jgi:hypothetical protein
VTLSSYLDIKARSRLLMKGSFVVATKSRKTWARCLLNSLSNMPNPNNILKAECYPEATAWQNGTCFKDVDKLGRQEFDMAEPRIRLGMVGGGEGAFIGAVHRIAARLDDRYELVAGALSASPDKAIGSAAAIGLRSDRSYPDFRTMARTEAGRTDAIKAVAIVTPNHMHARRRLSGDGCSYHLR